MITAKKIDKKEKILQAAIKLFSLNGFENTSMRELATEADINLAMINYYFQSKERLLEEVIKFKGRRMLDFFHTISEDESLSLMDRVDQIIDVHLDYVFNDGKSFNKMMYRELMLGHRENVCKLIESDIFFKGNKLFCDLIQRGIDEGIFQNVDIPLTISMVFGTTNQLAFSSNENMCKKWSDYFEFNSPDFQERVSTFLKSSAHALLLKND